jgi:hypothetical protein
MDLTESAEPRWKLSKIDMELPKLVNPYKLKLDPARKKDRVETALEREIKSNVDKDDPIWV